MTIWHDSPAELVTVGPVMPLAKCEARLQAEAGGGFLHAHVCVDCVSARAARLAEEQIGGQICAAPRCMNPPTDRCHCCARPFCSRCVGGIGCVLGQNGRLWLANTMPGVSADTSPNQRVDAPLCLLCATRCVDQQVTWEAAKPEPHVPLPQPRPDMYPYYPLFAGRYRRARARYDEAVQQRDAWRRRAVEATLQMWRARVAAPPVSHSEFSEGRWPSTVKRLEAAKPSPMTATSCRCPPAKGSRAPVAAQRRLPRTRASAPSDPLIRARPNQARARSEKGYRSRQRRTWSASPGYST